MGGGWQESVDNHTTMTAGDGEGRERACDDEGNNKYGEGSKGDGEHDEGAGQQGE